MFSIFLIHKWRKRRKRIKSSIAGRKLKKELVVLLKKNKQNTISELDLDEQQILEKIKQQTTACNLNNVTRTNAYFKFYLKFPQVHWALLAHFVSRNAGWNMTDLKGDLLSKILSETEQHAFFQFMERANWLIFQDAYPQLLLYEESVRQGKPFFHLLSHLGVSSFMQAIWSFFWQQKQSQILTHALIINEQNYIEKRVIQNPIFKEEVTSTLEFKLQDVFAFNYILFPYQTHGISQLKGLVVHLFTKLNQRIEIGFKLYSLLYENPSQLRSFVKWANQHPHTGSRSDYWRNVYCVIQEGIPTKTYKPRITDGHLKNGAKKLYSPVLVHVWKNTSHKQPGGDDWFKNEGIVKMLFKEMNIADNDVKLAYMKSLERLELAVAAKSLLS
ncbi:MULTISPECIES: DUF2515 family protein [Cytobacillus]|uniref:DUF2515 family protein n=1 Tax=Cytobacillus TaxID=2675230 RepID=UPI00296AD646|nr:DUF2515 family protein [Cytobacillus stercorigallinarum]